MLRQGFMNKYKIKSRYDNERFEKEDEGYLLKLTRPAKESSIRALNKEKMDKFIEDILTNKKMTSILYDSNAQKEINSSLKLINNFKKQNEKYIKSQKANLDPCSVVKRRSRKEAYSQMRTEIDNFQNKKENYKKNLLMQNYKKYIVMKKDLNFCKKENINYLRKNRIDSFKRSFDNLKLKIDDDRGKLMEAEYTSDQPLHNKTLENYYLFRNNYIDIVHSINLPNIKCDMNDVYSRLYNNKVLLTSGNINDKKIKNLKTITLNRHPLNTKKRKKTFLLNRKMTQNHPKVKLNLKNVLKSNGGKEFTVKVTDEIIMKCFDKYSGGPETIKYLKDEKHNGTKNIDDINKEKNIDGFVNFYKLAEKNTGNTYLHLAVIDGYPQLIKYFIDKGADINIKNEDGNTPLHLALKENNMDIIQILLNNNAKLDIPNNEGQIPFDFFTNEMKKKFGLEQMLIINPIRNKK